MPREEAAKILYEARVQARIQELQDEIDTRQLHLQADHSSLAGFQEQVGALALGSVDRARAGAETVQRSAAAIATLYAGVLGVAFSVTARPLPLRGVLAPLFLGVAIVLASGYLAFVGPTDHNSVAAPAGGMATEPRALARTRAFLALARNVVDRRSFWLRASVIALACGVFALPAPFVSATPEQSTAASAPEWPTAPTRQDKFGEILYQAQVTETASLRTKATARPAEDDSIVLLAGVALGGLLIAFGPRVMDRRARLADRATP